MTKQEPITDDLTVVSFLLSKAEKEDRGLTPLTINKLVYICHGCTLGYLDQPLIDNYDRQIQAWKHGPVVVNVYHKLKRFGRTPITLKKFRSCDLGNGEVDAKLKALKEKCAEVWKILNGVWSKYGHYTGEELRDITHEPGTPWGQCYNFILEVESDRNKNNPIPDEITKEYYKINDRRNLSSKPVTKSWLDLIGTEKAGDDFMAERSVFINFDRVVF